MELKQNILSIVKQGGVHTVAALAKETESTKDELWKALFDLVYGLQVVYNVKGGGFKVKK